MIHVPRNRVKKPKVLSGASCDGVVELKANLAARRKDRTAQLKFEVYRDPTVRAALDQLFHHKCAYCESNTGAGDIEHYRPKGAVWVWTTVGGKQKRKPLAHPGYYWLAASWDNLLLSCGHCNSTRYHRIDGDIYASSGKANFFPLRHERTRAKRPNAERQETRLLLNPCIDRPERHLRFLDDGRIEPEHPGARGAMADATIKNCGLSRIELVQARKRVATSLQNLIICIEENVAELPAKQASFDRNIDMVLVHLADDAPFSGFARQYVERHLTPILERVSARPRARARDRAAMRPSLSSRKSR